MLGNRSTGSTVSARSVMGCLRACKYISITAAALAGILASATAAFAANYEVSVDPTEADAVPSVTTLMTPDQRDGETFRLDRTVVKFPAGWKVNNPIGDRTTLCSVDNFDGNGDGMQAPTCAPSSIIGRGESVALLGIEIHANGSLYLLESDPDEEKVRAGLYLPAQVGDAVIPFRIYLDITLVGRPGQERIQADFNKSRTGPVEIQDGLPPVDSKSFSLTIDGGDRGIIRTAANCGDQLFESTITSGGVEYDKSDTVNLNGNCDHNFSDGLYSAVNWARDGHNSVGYDADAFQAIFALKVGQGDNPDLTFRVADDPSVFNSPEFGISRANNGAAGYQSIDYLSLLLGSPFKLDLSSARINSDIGDTVIRARAAQQTYTISGDIIKTDGGAKLVFNELPPSFVADNGRYELDVQIRDGEWLDIPDLPTAYEIRELYLKLNGTDAGGIVSKNNRPCSRGNGIDPPVSTFFAAFYSDRQAMNLWADDCTRGERAQWDIPLSQAAKQSKPGGSTVGPNAGDKSAVSSKDRDPSSQKSEKQRGSKKQKSSYKKTRSRRFGH